MMDRRAIQSGALAAVGVVGAMPILFLPQIIFHGAPSPGDSSFIAVTVACMVAGLVWAAWFAIASFRRAEEFVQERSKFAWYWGSLIGLLIAVPVFALIAMGGLPWIANGSDATRAFKLGMVLPIATQVAGFIVMSVWWRATKS
jgi:hypothetical protein